MSRLFHGAPVATLHVAGSLAVVLAFAVRSPAAAETLLRLEDYKTEDLKTTGFELPRKAHIEIEAVGVRPRWSDSFSAYAWILNSATREVVWSEDESNSSRVDDNRLLRHTKDDIDLEPGRYELYTWAGTSWSMHGVRIHIADFGNWSWRDDKDDDKNDDRHVDNSDHELRHAAHDAYVELRSNDVAKRDLKTFEPKGEIPGAIYRATKLGDHAFVQARLTVDRPTRVRVYSVCEFPRNWDDACDGGWMVNTATRERVWDIRRRNTHQGGGSEKNRVFDDEIELAAGRYELDYGTDDTHSWDEWNANPPYDPMNWGVTLLPGKNFDATAVHVEDKYDRGEPLLVMTRVGDQESIDRPFHLVHDGEIQILAVGEYNDRQDEFADYGWISKSGDRDVVWEMTDRNTTHAGGAAKNRMFDGVVKLEAGDYVAHFETDDSHSYRDWNADQPFQPEAWGLTLYPGSNLSTADFKALPAIDHTAKSGNDLVKLVQVGDSEHVHDTFTLDRPSKVHIFALGEGVNHEMADYGWIEDKKTGKTVWEMTWRNTGYAGGARKNRMFDDDISLDAGTYEVYYETDGSHSYGDWNDTPPRDPHSWGITVSQAGAK